MYDNNAPAKKPPIVPPINGALPVDVDTGVTAGVDVGTGDFVGTGLGIAVGTGVGAGVGLGIAVGTGVGAGVGLGTGVGVGVAVTGGGGSQKGGVGVGIGRSISSILAIWETFWLPERPGPTSLMGNLSAGNG